MTIVLVSLSTGSAFAAESLSKYVITLENVELKNSSGRWVSVIRPDLQVDLVTTKPSISFFNNGGRVPTGDYVNFRIELLDSVKSASIDGTETVLHLAPGKTSNGRVWVAGNEELQNSLLVKKGSFIRVWFDLEIPSGSAAARVCEASVTVDEQIASFPAEAVALSFTRDSQLATRD